MCKCKDKNGDAGQPWLEKEFTDKCPCRLDPKTPAYSSG
jgi:hypothetical protein